MPGSGVTAPYGTIDDTGRVELSSEVVEKTGAATVTKLAKTTKTSDRKIREMPMKKVSSVFDIQTINKKTASQGSQIRTCEHVSIYQPGVSGEQAAITPWNVASEFRR